MELINVCHGCLSVDRHLITVEDHAKLYHQLLLKKSNIKIKKLMMCWECHRILNNIHTFRLKITQAQKLLNKKSVSQHCNLSNLIVSKKVDDYQIIVYEDEKLNITPIEIGETRTIKQEICDTKLHIEIEIKDEDFKLKEELKDENNFDDQDITGLDEVNDDIDGQDITGLDEVLVPIDLLEKKVVIKVEQGRKKRGVLKKKYRTIIMDDIPDKRKYYDVITVDAETIIRDREIKKKKTSNKKFQCQRCYRGFVQQDLYERHLAVLHHEKNKYECDYCGARFPIMRLLTRHITDHHRRFQCKLCGGLFGDRPLLYMHFKHGPHGRRMECRKCQASFDCTKAREFFAHYREMHSLVVCDHCGMRSTTKRRLAHHIRIRHSEVRCKICNVVFEKFHSLISHNKRKHVLEPTERNYCVECDVQFPNNMMYKEHVRYSVKHRAKPRIPCPECDRTYSKRSYMTNHYNLEHLKSSKYICPICDRSFLNGHGLRNHVKYTHEKTPKTKNYICTHCDRGFNTRRILDNHVRTHTGERPFACARCPAAFAQRYALKTHERSAHK